LYSKQRERKKTLALLSEEDKKLNEKDFALLHYFLFNPEQEDMVRRHLQTLSMTERARRGESIEPEDVFSGMLNIKDIRERTRFPSYLDLRRHIYLRFLSHIVPEAGDIINAWVDEEAHEFISYPKGEGRKEGVEILAAKGMRVQGIAPIFLGERKLEEGKVGRFQRLKERLFPKREEE